ncbi:MAG: cyclic beta 1-2 glucan synthetase, partial [Polyangiales bacterium]
MLASAHRIARSSTADRLLPRLADNARELADAYALVADAVGRGRQITPAAEWFVDNYHLIEEHIRIARQHLPPGYSRELPRLVRAAGGLPRVYDLAIELISHSHGRIDVEVVRGFVTSYQVVQPLLLGELWAIPIMLRLALLENLRRVVAGVTAGRRDREEAGRWADRLLEVAANDPSRVVLVLAQLVDADPPLTDAFVSELASRLQGQGASSAFPVSWLEQKLAERGQTIVRAFQLASQSQAQDQVSVGNSITSLRLLTATDWRDFVEETSAVERVLRADPSGAYAGMDFATRDRYRHVIEDLSRRTRVPEVDVATRAVELAAAQPAGRAHHVGFFLIDRGRRALELALGGRPYDHVLVTRPGPRLRLPLYIGAIGALTGAAIAGLATYTPFAALAPPIAVTWLVMSALCASQLAISVVHWAATLLVPPRRLPRLDFSAGIAPEHRTIVAVPAMLTSAAVIDELVDAIEIRFLANRDPNLAFALVGDFRDAATEHVDGDAALLERATDAIAALNAKYPEVSRGGGFFLFHRARRWNARERAWMGWERKRGKLEDFNATLRGATDRFATVVGPVDRLDGVRYVIALDSDTELPRGAARELAGTLGHPLNRPVWDPVLGRVTEGYSILQPRVAITLASAGSSRFAQLFAGEYGIDPYTREVSDVYQDVFGEGSFIGKGIYDIDTVVLAIGGRLPDNRVLSHDLLEGAYGRAGLVSDVLLFEDFPAAHAVDASRRSRWIRGDWQIARWLLRRVPGGPSGDGRTAANPISMLSQWKILDNLRRSLVPLALLGLLVTVWCVPGVAPASLVLVVATLVLPGLLGAATAATRRSKEVTASAHAREVATNLGQHAVRELVTLACLPYDAMLNLIAIARATVRVLILRRKLLEWRTAADAQRAKRRGLVGSFVSMWVPPLFGAFLLAGVVAGRLEAAWLAAALGAAWIATPILVWWLARPIAPPSSGLSHDDVRFLHTLARRTWQFFETYVAAEDNDLPPDNFQEVPPVGVAHRTSPTNIGLALLANLGAYDLGYASTAEVIARTGRTFATLGRMARYRGHFYNWYDTRTLEPLRPMYVSTVDSGNLSGHLLTLAAGLGELCGDRVIRAQWFTGAADSLAIL